MNKTEEFLKENDFQIGNDLDGNVLMLSDDHLLFTEVQERLFKYAQQEKREAIENYAKYRDDEQAEQWIKMYRDNKNKNQQ